MQPCVVDVGASVNESCTSHSADYLQVDDVEAGNLTIARTRHLCSGMTADQINRANIQICGERG